MPALTTFATVLLAARLVSGYVSRPKLSPPVIWNITTFDDSTPLAPGYTFLTAGCASAFYFLTF
jgi:hypothetical protein